MQFILDFIYATFAYNILKSVKPIVYCALCSVCVCVHCISTVARLPITIIMQCQNTHVWKLIKINNITSTATVHRVLHDDGSQVCPVQLLFRFYWWYVRILYECDAYNEETKRRRATAAATNTNNKINSIIFFIYSLSFYIHFSSYPLHIVVLLIFVHYFDPIVFFTSICICLHLHTFMTCICISLPSSAPEFFSSHICFFHKSLTTATNVISILWCDWNNIFNDLVPFI